MKKDFISLKDFSSEEIRSVLTNAIALKAKRLTDDPLVIKNKTGVLLFEKPSLRTRITFETAIHELGGHAINLDSSMVQMGTRETVADVARNMERWTHLIIARTFKHSTLVELAKHSNVPVINALTDTFHPCQALAFGQTVIEHFRDTQNITVTFIGDGNNVCMSHMILAAKLGWNFVLACPHGYEPMKEITTYCKDLISKNSGSLTITTNPKEAVRNASIIYTDVWTSMGQENETAMRLKEFAEFQVNKKLISVAPDDVKISHCLPAHRGEEITNEVMDSPACIAFDEAENRLHAQKAIIVQLFS